MYQYDGTASVRQLACDLLSLVACRLRLATCDLLGRLRLRLRLRACSLALSLVACELAIATDLVLSVGFVFF